MKSNLKFFKKKKSLPVDKFLQNVLYDKKFGYYSSQVPFGEKGDFIMTGTEGENWPIKSKIFKNTYSLLNQNYAYKKKIIVNAIKMSVPFKVKVSWCDDILNGKKDDFLIEYSKGDYGIVDQSIFKKTYKIV